jgi:predicted adenine nucleotide alpha hydrolase (AANH) superfamily ATPase
MKVLVHICCGPCSIHPFEKLAEEGHEVVGYWYNPNIHPYVEYKKRLMSLKNLQELHGFEIYYNESYDLEEHLKAIMSDLGHRCRKCYKFRLLESASYAREHDFDAFTTTLLVSPYQKQEWIIEIGKSLEATLGIRFLPIDFTPGFREGKQKAYDMGLYMQKYCGCIFSERERYEKRRK